MFTLSETPLIADHYKNVEFQLLAEAETYRKELEKYLLNFSRRTAVYDEIAVVDERGRAVCHIKDGEIRPKGGDRSADEAFLQARRLRPAGWWVSPVRALEGGTQALEFSKAVRDEVGRFKGALLLRYDLAQLGSILENTGIGREGRAYIQAGDAVIGARAKRSEKQLLRAQSPIVERNWTLNLEAPLEAFLDPIRQVKYAAVVTALGGLAVLAGMLLPLVRSITSPIQALVHAAARIGAGDLSYRIQDGATGELATLSLAFNDMAGKLDENRRQLIQAEKLSAVGQMISSVAHELNNPLAAATGFVQVALDEDCPPKVRGDLERTHHNIIRCRKVVENLLFFVRKSAYEKVRIDVNDAVRSAINLIEYRLQKTDDVQLVQEIEPALPPVIGDPLQISQVVMNLINNACDAMAETIRYPLQRRLVVRTRAEPSFVVIGVADNGPGIPDPIRDKIFEPFFTTKAPGRGTGLGLSISREIVKQHGGDITFDSRVGQGTVFWIKLPAATESELAGLKDLDDEELVAAVPGKRILVVDDEKDLSDLIARVLREDGDEVDSTCHSLEALDWIRERDYDLIVSDMEMEQGKGPDIHRELSQREPNRRSRLLFVTGDILNPKVLAFLSRTKSPYLVKPFDVEELRQAARRVLRGLPLV